MTNLACRSALAFFVMLAAASWARAQSVEQFYRGKTISMIVPADPGGSYDLHTRVIARHIAKFIPGSPTVIVQNMQGAGGLRAINYLYERAPQDGTVLGMPVQENLIADVLGGADVRYRVAEFNWIGRLATSVDLIVVWHTTGVKTIEDARRIPVAFGATGPASGTTVYPTMLKNMFGAKFSVTPGYKHTEMLLAMERGETAGVHTSWTTLRGLRPDWISEHKVNFLVHIADKVPELAGVPTLVELGRTPEEKQVLAIFSSAGAIGRSVALPPHVPVARVAALRAAFDVMVEDTDFRADVERSHAEFGPMSGAALQKLIADSRNVSPAVLERARAVVMRR